MGIEPNIFSLPLDAHAYGGARLQLNRIVLNRWLAIELRHSWLRRIAAVAAGAGMWRGNLCRLGNGNGSSGKGGLRPINSSTRKIDPRDLISQWPIFEHSPIAIKGVSSLSSAPPIYPYVYTSMNLRLPKSKL